MSTLPPPTPTTSNSGHTAQQRQSRTVIAGGLLAVALLAGGGTYLATRDNSTSVAAATPTSVTTVTTVAPAATDVPGAAPTKAGLVDTTPGETPDESPDETSGEATATIVVPDGAVDLGDGVYVPLDEDVEVSGDDPLTFSNTTDGNKLILQVLQREAGEDPNMLLQEYISTFDEDYAFAAYLPSEITAPGVDGHPNVRAASVSYSIIGTDGSRNLVGMVWAYVRNDGLSLVGDVYGPATGPAISEASFSVMLQSLADAPAIGDTADWFDASPALPRSSHPTAELPYQSDRRLAVAPGYELTDVGLPVLTIHSATDTLAVTRLSGLANLEAAQQAVWDTVQPPSGTRASLTPGTFAPGGNTTALSISTAACTVASDDGTSYRCAAWFVYDPTTHNALVVYATHATDQWDANAELLMVDSVLWQVRSVA